MNLKFVWRVLAGWIVFVVAEMVSGVIIPIHMPMAPHSFRWLLASNLLTVAALAWAGSRAGWARMQLAAGFFAIGFSILLVNAVEGYFFLSVPGLSWPRLVLNQGISMAILAVVLGLLFGAAPKSEQGEKEEGWLGGPGRAIVKFVACDVLYLVLYFTAGLIVIPFVRDFYTTQHIPPFATIVTLQLSLRGPIFVLLIILLTRMIAVRRTADALGVGLIFTILTGVTQLMIPNPFFPAAVRWAHFCEVVSSMFVFGFLVSMLWKHRDRKVAVQTVASPA